MIKYLLCAIIVTLTFVLHIVRNKISKERYFILKTIFVVLFIEITIFNINSYRTDFGKLEKKYFDKNTINDYISITERNTQYIFVDNINTKVKSIYIELEGVLENQIVDYDIFYSDNSTSTRYLSSKSYCQNVDKTKYSSIHLSRRL